MAGFEVGWQVISLFMDVLCRYGRKYAIYRGQANKSWALVPSAYRNNSVGIDHPAHLRDWKMRASRFANPMPRDDIEWLILAQHFGLATPLLDWTVSPLIALFFACDDPTAEDEVGTVWWTLQTKFERPYDTLMLSPFGNGATRHKPFLIDAIGRNARSTAQDSLLTLHTPEDYRTLTAERIFDVEPHLKRPTLDTLMKLGISSERLHADLTRLVERIKREMLGRRA